MTRVLVVEDDPDIHALLKRQLENEGFSVTVVDRGDAGLAEACANPYDLVILDVNLPGMLGMEICKGIRTKKPRVPILMLTARADEIDKVVGLELGADDYVTKPFGIRELLARVKALLRRTSDPAPESRPPDQPASLHFNDVAIDLDGRVVSKAGVAIRLTATEFDLLAFLAANRGRVFSREQLIEQVWGYSSTGYERSVNTLMSRLRSKIEDDPDNPRMLITVWGVGYKFGETDTGSGNP